MYEYAPNIPIIHQKISNSNGRLRTFELHEIHETEFVLKKYDEQISFQNFAKSFVQNSKC